LSWVTNDDGAVLVERDFAQKIHDLAAEAASSAAVGLVADHQARIVDERAGDRDALLLAAGKLARQPFAKRADAEPLQRLPCPLDGIAPGHARGDQRHARILGRGQVGSGYTAGR
jgi:hypothetical protein